MSSRRDTSRFSSREGRERSDGKERSDDYDRKNARGSGRDRSPLRGPGGSDRNDYSGSRRSPGRRSPRRGDRSSPSRRSPGRRSPRRSSPRRSPPGSRSNSYRGSSFTADRDSFAADPFRRDLRGSSGAPNVPDVVSKMSSISNAREPARCELLVLDVDGRQCMYAENLQRRLNDVHLGTELVVLRADSSISIIQKAVQDSSQKGVLFACVINEQNALHRSLTVNILHGQQQEHRNMPLDSAFGLIVRSFEQWNAAREDLVRSTGGGLVQPGKPLAPIGGLQARKPVSDTPDSLKRPDENITRMLRMVIDGRTLVVEELDEIIGYFQELRNKLATERGIAPLMQPTKIGDREKPTIGGQAQVSGIGGDRIDVQEKIMSLLQSDPSLLQVLKTSDLSLRQGPQAAEKLLNLLHESQKVRSSPRTEFGDQSHPGLPQRFSGNSSLLGDPTARSAQASLGGQRDSLAASKDFKGMQDKIMDIFHGRDSHPSAAQKSTSYGRDNQEYKTMPPNDFKQTKMAFGGDASRMGERSNLLEKPFGSTPMEQPTNLEKAYAAEGAPSEGYGDPSSAYGDSAPANGRMNYRPPWGGAPQFGGGFNMPPPGFAESSMPGFRNPGHQPRPMRPPMQQDWMQQPPQRFSRFS